MRMQMQVEDEVERYHVGANFLAVWVPKPGLFYCRIVGVAVTEFIAPVLRGCERAIQGDCNALFFNDWLELDRYESTSRIDVTRWAIRHRQRVIKSHVLLRSKLVAMGVEVANLALGQMFSVYGERLTFDATLRGALDAKGIRAPAPAALRPAPSV